MTVNRTAETMDMLEQWTEDIEDVLARGARSARLQLNVEGHTDPLTLLGNAKGVFIIEPGQGVVPAREWLAKEAA